MRVLHPVRRKTVALFAGWLSLAACSSGGGDGGGGGGGPPTATYVGSFAPDSKIVAGHGDRVVTWAWPRATVYRQDAADPTLLVQEGTLRDCDSNAHYVAVNDQWIAIAGEEWVSYSPVSLVGYVQLARAGGPYALSSVVQLDGWTAADRATAWNDRLVVASGASLRIYDITSLAAPVLLGEHDAGANVTAMAATGGGVWVFTDNGYLFADLATGTFFFSTEIPELAGVESAQVYGGKLRIGGRSKYAGYYRVARLDPSWPPALAIEADDDRIVDGNASGNNVGGMAFDAGRGQYVLVAETQPYPMSGQPGASALPRFSDGAAIAPLDSVSVDRAVCLTWCPVTMNVAPRMHVNAGVAYLIPDPSPSQVPVFAYRLP